MWLCTSRRLTDPPHFPSGNIPSEVCEKLSLSPVTALTMQSCLGVDPMVVEICCAAAEWEPAASCACLLLLRGVRADTLVARRCKYGVLCCPVQSSLCAVMSCDVL